jgi:transposase InsO family protein
MLMAPALLFTRGSINLGYGKPNTSAIERRNGTARRMSAHQVRRSLAFSHRPETKITLGWWAVTVYNWCRPHRALRHALPLPEGKKSLSLKRLRWPWGLPISFGRFVTRSSPRCSQPPVGDNLM